MKFSDERELFAAAGMLSQTPPPRLERPAAWNYFRLIADNRWKLLLITLLASLVGVAATVSLPRVYEANLLIQIADSAGPPKSMLGEAANAFDIKTPATAEMEIMRSRMVVAPAVEKNELAVVAQPRYFPIVGGWQSRNAQSLATLQGNGRADPNAPAIAVRQFDVPTAWEGETFIVRVEQDKHYSLRHPSLAAPLQANVGELLEGKLGEGRLSLLVSRLEGRTGAEFTLVRKSRGKATEDLQDALKLVERGRQSGIIEVTLRDTDPVRAAAVLNTIGANYVKQAVERKSAEAEKSIAFLNAQLPALRQQMDKAEGAYNQFRSRRGTVSFEDEAKIALERSSDLKSKVAEAQQKRRDLLSSMGAEHPSVRVVDQQIAGWQSELHGIQGKLSAMPGIQQDALRYERDVKLNSDLYQQLRTSALQLQLVREGLSGNARVIDAAVPPEEAIRPKPAIMLGIASMGGLVLALSFILVRSGLARGVKSAREIETGTGLKVYSSAIPMSAAQRRAGRRPGKLLALSAPSEDASVCLRQLRTLLLHQMRDRADNRLLITAPTEGVGVNFIISNLGAISAMAGRRILLVDADPKRGSLHRAFGMGDTPGLSDLVAGHCTRKEAIRNTGIPRLDFVAAGTAPLKSDELTTSRAWLELLDQASKDYDLVLLNAPPILRSSETLSLALGAAMVVLVARAGKTAVEEIAECARRLTQAGQLPSGVVLNGV
jgi:tyrosine-protein kinase Etk/Wzc